MLNLVRTAKFFSWVSGAGCVFQEQGLGVCFSSRGWVCVSGAGAGCVLQEQGLGVCYRSRGWVCVTGAGAGCVFQEQELGVCFNLTSNWWVSKNGPDHSLMSSRNTHI